MSIVTVGLDSIWSACVIRQHDDVSQEWKILGIQTLDIRQGQG